MIFKSGTNASEEEQRDGGVYQDAACVLKIESASYLTLSPLWRPVSSHT